MFDYKNIVLIGFMGSGKTTVGNLLAAQLQWQCIDTDILALKKSGLDSINEIFETYGEKYWRQLETEVTDDITRNVHTVISTGGGIILHEVNISNLKKNGVIIYLDTPFKTIQKRLELDTTRPLFKNLDRAHFLFAARQALYLQNADVILSTQDKTPTQLCLEIQLLVTHLVTLSHQSSITNSIENVI